ncbi:MAG TPA: alpha-hydroxy acid oxidase [Vicinamibacterales bacterium]|nr:alpha-hydroxy acid oxidase [Vicinamibacterales bacterium]
MSDVSTCGAGPVSVADFEARARECLPSGVYDFCAGGAGDERTLAANEAAFADTVLLPRALEDTSRVDTSLSLLGAALNAPLLLAPVAFNRLLHPDGELAAARAAAAVGVAMVASTMASCPLEDIAAAANGTLWFQLYVLRDRGLTRELIRRSEAAGYDALVLTVDTPRIGRRERDLRNAFRFPADARPANLQAVSGSGLDSGAGFVEFNRAVIDPVVTWDTVAWLTSVTRLPVVLKGVLSPDDAQRGVAAGAAAIIVSNHGGRQLDGALATLDALPDVVERVSGRCPVLLDGGVRRGVDVLAARALGATAVLIGRPYLWGLAVDGERGVTQVLNLLRQELELAMALSGCRCLSSIAPSLIWNRRTRTHSRDAAVRSVPRGHCGPFE